MGDEISLRAFGFFLADGAANLVLFLNQQSMVTTRLYFHQALEWAQKPEALETRLETLLGVRRADAEALAGTAEELAGSLVEMATVHGVTVESDVLLV